MLLAFSRLLRLLSQLVQFICTELILGTPTIKRHWTNTTTTAGPSPTASIAAQSGSCIPSSNTSNPFAIAYSPYTSSGQCKTVSEIKIDLQQIEASGFQTLRLYGTDCNQVENVLLTLDAINSCLTLFLGIFDTKQATREADNIISALKGDWTKVVTISVGNEVVNSGQIGVSEIVSTTSRVKAQLRSYVPRILETLI